MVFKQKIIKVKKKSSFVGNLFGTISIVIVFFVGFFALEFVNSINFNLGDKLLNINTNKSDTGSVNNDRINILILGRGGGDHDAPDLTDTIILANINLKDNIVNMLSIPRDLYVEYPNGKEAKINEVYLQEGVLKGDKKKGIKALEDKIKEITGESVDYYVGVDFKGFIELVDVFGGVEITLDENFVDYQYPDGKLGYTTFVLRKGTWTLDGEVALKYVRSRHSTSDFDRSYRQQQVIKSLKDKIVSEGFLKNAYRIKDLYNIFNKYIETDLDLETIIKLSYFGKKADNTKILSYNLNDSCFYGSVTCAKGGLLYVPERSLFNNLSVLLPYGSEKGDISNYDKVKIYTDLIFNKSGLFIENYKINVLNGTKVSNLASYYADEIKKYGFNVPGYDSIGNTKEVYEKSIIYYYSDLENSETLKGLAEIFSGSIIKSEESLIKDNDASIEIILGKDYEDVFNL